MSSGAQMTIPVDFSFAIAANSASDRETSSGDRGIGEFALPR